MSPKSMVDGGAPTSSDAGGDDLCVPVPGFMRLNQKSRPTTVICDRDDGFYFSLSIASL